MTRAEFNTMVRSIGIPSAYHYFPEGTAEPPPFICFYETFDNDVNADNENYVKIRQMIIELYTDEKDFALEGRIESTLRANGLPYRFDSTYLDDQKLYMSVYTMEVIFNA